MKKTLKYTGITLLFLLVAGYIFLRFSATDEGYFRYSPYIDTRMAEQFEPEKFALIAPGMTQDKVEITLGKPINLVKSPQEEIPGTMYAANYSMDGKCGWMDFAWKSFDVYYDSNMTVVKTSSRWWDD